MNYKRSWGGTQQQLSVDDTKVHVGGIFISSAFTR